MRAALPQPPFCSARPIVCHKRLALPGRHFGHNLWRLSLCPRGSFQTAPHLRHVLLPLAQDPREAQFKHRWLWPLASVFAAPCGGKKVSQVRQANQPARSGLRRFFASAPQAAQTAAHGMVAAALLNSEIGFSARQTEHSKAQTSFKHFRQRRAASESP